MCCRECVNHYSFDGIEPPCRDCYANSNKSVERVDKLFDVLATEIELADSSTNSLSALAKAPLPVLTYLKSLVNRWNEGIGQ